MASLLKSDEINKLQDYEEYFDVMNISREQKLERIELAELLDDVFLFLFVYADANIQTNAFDIEDLYEIGERRYLDALEEYGIDFDKHPSIKEYASGMVKDILDSCVKNSNITESAADESDNKDQTTSGNVNHVEHAVNVAKNEANTVLNMVEYDDALANGYATKTWRTENDDKVRYTHRSVDGQTIPIDGIFLVGDSQMRFPRDYGLGATPSEVIGCRCSLQFGKDDKLSSLLKNGAEDDIIQLSRKKEDLYDFEPISDKRFEELTIEVRKLGANIIRGDETILRHLAPGDLAVTISDTIIFREKVSVSAVLEETYHFKQNYYKMFEEISDIRIQALVKEIDAQKYLIDISAKYKIPRTETEHTKKMLDVYTKKLEEYCLKNDLNYEDYI